MHTLASASCSSHLKCCCSPALGMQTYCCCGGWWQLSERKPQPRTEWAYGATAASPFIASIMLHWNQRLSDNACSLSNGCTGSEETENCGTYTPHCCWNNWTHATISWVGCFLFTFEVQAYGLRNLLVTCWILVELCSRWICHFIM